VDWRDIAPTAEWQQEILTNIEAADNFIFVIGSESAALPNFPPDSTRSRVENRPSTCDYGWDTIFRRTIVANFSSQNISDLLADASR